MDLTEFRASTTAAEPPVTTMFQVPEPCPAVLTQVPQNTATLVTGTTAVKDPEPLGPVKVPVALPFPRVPVKLYPPPETVNCLVEVL